MPFLHWCGSKGISSYVSLRAENSVCAANVSVGGAQRYELTADDYVTERVVKCDTCAARGALCASGGQFHSQVSFISFSSRSTFVYGAMPWDRWTSM